MNEQTIDRHSVNCYFCHHLVDERECLPADEYNDGDGGSICPECQPMAGEWFALASDGRIYALCNCGDFEAAEESAADVLPDGETVVWLADEATAGQWFGILRKRMPEREEATQ